MSALEDELAVQLTAAGLEFAREFTFHPGRRWRADFLLREICTPESGVLIDVQGIGPQGRHGSWDHIESDCEKFSTAAALGYRVLPVTGKMVRSGAALALIEAALGLKALPVHRRATKAAKVKPKASAKRTQPKRSWADVTRAAPGWPSSLGLGPASSKAFQALPDSIKRAAARAARGRAR